SSRCRSQDETSCVETSCVAFLVCRPTPENAPTVERAPALGGFVHAMIATDRFRDFQHDHGVTRAHTIHARDGEIWYARNDAGTWVVSWYPHRSDHPDAPSSSQTLNAKASNTAGSEGAIGAR